MQQKMDYFCFKTIITSNPTTDATIGTIRDNGADVVGGLIVGAVVNIAVTSCAVEAVGCNDALVVKGTGAALPRWDVVPVLKIVSVPNWFDTESLTS